MKAGKAIRTRLLLLFDIKEEELNKTLLLQAYIFIVITTLLIVKPTINSLFLHELSSDALPLGYLLTALAAVSGSWYYNKGLEKAPLNRIIEWTLWGSVLSLGLFGAAFRLGFAEGLLLYIPYMWVSIFGLLAASQFWILANLVYNIREAKRIFGFIGAGAIAGAIFGGYFTSILARFMEAEDLFFVAAGLIAICIPILRYIWKSEVLKLNTYQVSKRKGPRAERPVFLIRQSRLLSRIALVIGLSVLVAKLVDFQYSDYASRLIDDPDQLASFFGFWLSTLSLVSLGIQLFLTKRVVGMLGVGRSLLLMPAGILAGSALLIFVPELWVIVFIKVIDGSFKQSINKAATELLSIPVPIEIKSRTKTFIDVVIDSVATGIAGVTLIFFINGLNVPAGYVSLLIILLILVWMYFILRLKEEYINAFKNLFIDATAKRKKEKPEFPVTSIVDSVKRVLREGKENQILYMLRKTLEVKDERFFAEIAALLDHPSARVRSLAIENLYFLGSRNLYDRIKPMVNDPDQEVTTSAFRYILKYHEYDVKEFFESYLDSKDPTIVNAAIVGLAQEVRNHDALKGKFDFTNRIGILMDRMEGLTDKQTRKNSIIALLKAIGNAKVRAQYDFISTHLNDGDAEICRAAVLAASGTLQPEFIDPIVENLSRRDVRDACIEALFNYGEPILASLTVKTVNREVKNEDAIHIPSVIEMFNSQKAVRALMRIIDHTEHEVKVAAIESLRRIKWSNNAVQINDRLIIDKILDECEIYQRTLAAIYLQIVVQYKKHGNTPANQEEQAARTALIRLLENQLDLQLQRIFKYLGMKYPPSEIDPMLEVFLQGKEEQRIQAIEFLDNILDVQLKKELIPITESTLIDAEYDEKLKRMNVKVPGETECLIGLMQRNDAKLKLAVLLLMEKTGDPKFLPVARQFTAAPNAQVRRQAIQAAAALSAATS